MKNGYLSNWAKNAVPSPTLAVDAKAKALKAAGEDVCGFGSGEPDFDTPEFIKEACVQALSDAKTKYAPAAGVPALREALANKYLEKGVLEHANQSGCYKSRWQIFMLSCYVATCGHGDEVIIPAPYWVSYPEMVKLSGAIPKVIFSGEENGFKISPDQIKEAISSSTRMIILNSPFKSYWLLVSKRGNGRDCGISLSARYFDNVR